MPTHYNHPPLFFCTFRSTLSIVIDQSRNDALIRPGRKTATPCFASPARVKLAKPVHENPIMHKNVWQHFWHPKNQLWLIFMISVTKIAVFAG
jgi:hypothetical protein